MTTHEHPIIALSSMPPSALRLDCGEHEALTAIDGEIAWREYARETTLSEDEMRDATR
jgi:hypothetical protein